MNGKCGLLVAATNYSVFLFVLSDKAFFLGVIAEPKQSAKL